jgi:hypothetical protein
MMHSPRNARDEGVGYASSLSESQFNSVTLGDAGWKRTCTSRSHALHTLQRIQRESNARARAFLTGGGEPRAGAVACAFPEFASLSRRSATAGALLTP